MPTPIIQSNQIAIDPRNGLLYYKDENGNVISASLNWKEQDASNEITTDRNTVTLSHNLVVNGSLTVNGDTATISAQTVTIEDNILLLNSNVSATPSTNAGIEVERGISNNVSLRWNESTDRWEVTNDGTTYYEVLTTGSTTLPASVVTLTGTQTLTNKTLTSPVITGISPTITLGGDLSGSVTLTDLGNATLNATVINNSVALGTDTTGEYVSRLAAGSGITVSNNSGESATPNISIDTAVVQTRVADISDTEIGYLNGVTSAIQTQIDSKAPTSGPTFTGTTTLPSTTSIGNVSDTEIGYLDGVTSGIQAQFDTKAPTNGATFTGTTTLPSTTSIGDVSSTEIGYVNGVTSAIQTQLDAKANSATPNFTGMATIPKITVGGIEIDTTSPADTNVLKYNASLNKYIPGVATVVATLDDLTNVSAATPVQSQPLIWDGTNWQSGPFNQYLRLGENGVTDYVDLSAVSLNFNPMDGRYGDFSTDEVLIGNLDGFIARLNPSEVTINNTVYEAQLLPQELKWTNQSNGNQTKIQPIGATNGQVLAFNAGSSSYVPSDISVDSLSDVSAATPTSDQVLSWDASTSRWVNKTFSAVVNAIDAIGDVTAPSPSSGDYLKWSGSAWINDSVDLGTDTNGNYISGVTEGTGVTITHTPGEGSTPTFAIGQSVATSAVPTFAGLNLTQNGVLIFEGATDDNFETTLSVIDPTADRTISLPNISGTVITTGDTETVTSTMIANGTIVNDDINASAAIVYSKLSLNNSVDYTDLKDGVAKAGFRSTINNKTSGDLTTNNYTLLSSDLAKLVTVDNGATNASVTIPLSLLSEGDKIDVLNKGTGMLSIKIASGGTLVCTPQGTANQANLRARYSSATLIKLDSSNTWLVIGDLQA